MKGLWIRVALREDFLVLHEVWCSAASPPPDGAWAPPGDRGKHRYSQAQPHLGVRIWGHWAELHLPSGPGGRALCPLRGHPFRGTLL